MSTPPELLVYETLGLLAVPALHDALARAHRPEHFATWGGASRIGYHIGEIAGLLTQTPVPCQSLDELDEACARLIRMLRLTRFDLVYDSHDLISMATQDLLAGIEEVPVRLSAWIHRDDPEVWVLPPQQVDAPYALGQLAAIVLRYDLAGLSHDPLVHFLARRSREGADLAWLGRMVRSARQLDRV